MDMSPSDYRRQHDKVKFSGLYEFQYFSSIDGMNTIIQVKPRGTMTLRLTVYMTLICMASASAQAEQGDSDLKFVEEFRFEPLRLSVRNMTKSFGRRYPEGREYLLRIDELEKQRESAVSAFQADRQKSAAALREYASTLENFKREALLANPLLDFEKLLVVKRSNPTKGKTLNHNLNNFGIPSNHECNSSLPRSGYDNEIATLSPVAPQGKLSTVYKPNNGGYVGMVDLHHSAEKMIFTASDATHWMLREVAATGGEPRQITEMPPDVDCMDGAYLPDGGVVFASTASYQSVPCWHGQRWVGNLYRMDADGSGVRQLCFDQDHDYHPSVLDNGQILYTRWDYTGINHIYLRQLMVMNPDGTGQRAIYGSNSWFPNSLFHMRQIPGKPGMLAGILSGYHGVHKMGWLVVLDTSRGSQGKDGILCRISGRGDPVRVEIKDALVDDDWPKFMHPYPLDDKYFLVSCLKDADSDWAVYLADVYDNLTLLYADPEYALLEPIPLKSRAREPVIPSKVNLDADSGVVYLQNVYSGPGLKGVPAGVVKRLRVIAYHFGYRHMAGPHKIGYGGPWEVMRILGTVPVEEDGSAMFTVPANTPIAVQALDGQGQSVQLMRSWMTVMPGEFSSCIGCHEDPRDTPVATATIASRHPPRPLEEWYGLARGFDFEREVQPVLDASCVECHDGGNPKIPDLRAEKSFPEYKGLPMSILGRHRQHPDMKKVSGDRMKYTPAYDALLPYVRRVGIEDDVSLLIPGTYRADSSELIQMLRNGHKGVRLDGESWERLITWIDLNAPCHGSWNDAFKVPENADVRRRDLAARYAGIVSDPEAVVKTPPPGVRQLSRRSVESRVPSDAASGFDVRDGSGDIETCTVRLSDSVSIELVRIPAGEFLMGDAGGRFNEKPAHRVRIEKPFWMARFEISNAQYALFDPEHESGYYSKRNARSDDQGLPLDDPRQPVIKICYNDAVRYCAWLSEKSGVSFRLPTEAEWEFACRAGSEGDMFFGGVSDDFSQYANMADLAFRTPYHVSGVQITGGVSHLALCGAELADRRFNDGFSVTAPVGSYKPNRFGLYDMHGNIAEWTSSRYREYAAAEASPEVRYVLRGGSFYDRPASCRSAVRIGYEPWHRVFNAGFRVVSDQAMTE